LLLFANPRRLPFARLLSTKPRKSDSRAQWAAEIIAAHKQGIEAHKQSLEAILKMGRSLTAAKHALPHGEFQKMIEHNLPFTSSTAERLMKIARDPRIRKAARAQLLPVAWGALYELAQLPDAAFKRAIESRAIHPAMTREQARTVRFKITQEDARTVVPRYVTHDATPTRVAVPRYVTRDSQPEPRLGSVRRTWDTDVSSTISSIEATISQIERLVNDLVTTSERGERQVNDSTIGINYGEVSVDAFGDRIRAVVKQLLTLIGDDDRRALN
jgi:hypothetical protein